jgi:DNA-binding transcriptional LysR family regulator
MFTWDDLKHFLAFARKGSILSAAKAQGVNQSTVLRRLAELEERLGCQLVERHLTGYQLTEVGHELRPFAERIEEGVAALERHLASRDQKLIGTIRVTCSPTVGDRLKRTPLIDAFVTRNPGLRVEMVMTDRFLDLSKGEADIAIRSQGDGVEDEALFGRKIAEGAWAVYASHSYVERYGRPDGLENIARHAVVQFEGTIADHSAARWLRAVAPHATVSARSESFPGLVLAVKSGAGIAPLPIVLGDREGELVRVIDNLPELVTHFYLLTHRDLQRTPRVRAFLDFVDSEIRAFRTVLSGQAERQNSEPKPPALDHVRSSAHNRRARSR